MHSRFWPHQLGKISRPESNMFWVHVRGFCGVTKLLTNLGTAKILKVAGQVSKCRAVKAQVQKQVKLVVSMFTHIQAADSFQQQHHQVKMKITQAPLLRWSGDSQEYQ